MLAKEKYFHLLILKHYTAEEWKNARIVNKEPLAARVQKGDAERLPTYYRLSYPTGL